PAVKRSDSAIIGSHHGLHGGIRVSAVVMHHQAGRAIRNFQTCAPGSVHKIHVFAAKRPATHTWADSAVEAPNHFHDIPANGHIGANDPADQDRRVVSGYVKALRKTHERDRLSHWI